MGVPAGVDVGARWSAFITQANSSLCHLLSSPL